MNWNDLLAAFALYLVLEGIIPFVSPSRFRQFIQNMSRISDEKLRSVGFCSMVAGVILLYIVR